jgi:DNA-binding NarL/FixJ family response regulator
LGNAEIAGLGGLSDGDVKMHLLEIFRILGVATRTQAAIVSFFLRSRLEGTSHRDTDH